jgi:hypothetical protein
VVDTTYVYIPRGSRIWSVTELEVPQNAPTVHYEFTGYVCEADTVNDTDSFGFSVTEGEGKAGGGSPVLSGTFGDWKLLSGWFGEGGKEVPSSRISSFPREFALMQNYPNPFNPVTEIVYLVPEGFESGVEVELFIYDLRGRLIRRYSEGLRRPGRHSIVWDGRDDRGAVVGSGVYFYRLRASEFEGIRKMILAR